MKERKTFGVKFWNADTDEWEVRRFTTDDLDSLMELEIIDFDCLGYYMNDHEAFEKAFDAAMETPMTTADMVEIYLNSTDKDLVIEPFGR